MPCAITLRSRLLGPHVHSSVFIGEDADHLVLAGTLTFTVGQYQIFGAALLAAAEQLGEQHLITLPDATEAGVHQALAQQDEREYRAWDRRRPPTPAGVFQQVAPGVVINTDLVQTAEMETEKKP
jgi:hypothetical protein